MGTGYRVRGTVHGVRDTGYEVRSTGLRGAWYGYGVRSRARDESYRLEATGTG